MDTPFLAVYGAWVIKIVFGTQLYVHIRLEVPLLSDPTHQVMI